MKTNITLFIFTLFTFCVFSQETYNILVQEMSYFPNEITIEVGDQISFTHEGLGTHDVNFTTNSLTFEPFNNPAEITTLPAEGQYQSEPGLMGVITFDVPGTYSYDCSMYGHAAMGMVGSITVNEQGCEDDNSFIEANFSSFFISDCTGLIDFLYNSYGYSTFDSCNWDGAPMTDFGGMTISDICECSCEGIEEESTTVVDIIVNSEDHNTLETAVVAAGLVDVLSGEGTFTVFAPTDDAFAKLPEGTVETLLKPENREKLKSILLYHVVAGNVMAETAVTLDSAKTLQGSSLSIMLDGKTLKIDGATVTQVDIKASNGVIHVIDSVILPKS